MTSPVEHVNDALSLTNDGIVDLYEITLRNTGASTVFIRFKDGPIGKTSTWGPKTFDHLPCKLSTFTRTSEDQKSRPTLTLMNPQGIFNAPAHAGQFDGATLQHFRVLRAHFEAGILISDNRVWFIARPKDLIGGQSISFELRALSDGPDQLIPARVYIRPDFPFVRF